MSVSECLLGFDVRVPLGEDLWPLERRRLFLIRDDVAAPLSVDTMVWPSVFDERQTPEWIGGNAGLWEDLGKLRRHWTGPAATDVVGPYSLIAVAWWSDAGFEDASDVGPYADPTNPPQRDETWRLLGFDVADGSLLSGLSNCGFEAGEAAPLEHFAADLNDHHLLATLDAAFAFRDATNARVPEHAPFFVYALHEIPR
jgi:hypothetical protein